MFNFKRNVIICFAILVLLLLQAPMAIVTHNVFKGSNVVSHAQTSACTASNSLRVTSNPLPNSFNFLTTAVISGFIVAGIQQYSIYPFPVGPNASLVYNQSIVNSVTHNSNYTQWTFN